MKNLYKLQELLSIKLGPERVNLAKTRVKFSTKCSSESLISSEGSVFPFCHWFSSLFWIETELKSSRKEIGNCRKVQEKRKSSVSHDLSPDLWRATLQLQLAKSKGPTKIMVYRKENSAQPEELSSKNPIILARKIQPPVFLGNGKSLTLWKDLLEKHNK